MRGISDSLAHVKEVLRFNPAYAGNMAVHVISRLASQVQPRVCGEYNNNHFNLTSFSGSTPRMRGISRVAVTIHCLLRFNPAYAGNIHKFIRRNPNKQVQPRVCGEYKFISFTIKGFEGSTPRMRGISQMESTQEYIIRFNPAYAGNI